MNPWDIRRSDTRGAFRNDWLDARFSFSFGEYDAPARRRFGPLLALNEDRVQPGTGFPMHPHRDLEIVMLPLSGEVEHHDDRGGHAIVRPGQWQWMRAGTGIRHRQWNPSPAASDHHLQIWLEPMHRGLLPRVEVFAIEAPAPGTWHTLIARQPVTGAQVIGVDCTLALGVLTPDQPLQCLAHEGGRYLHVIEGEVLVTGADAGVLTLHAGDALARFDCATPLVLSAKGPGRLLRFDTAAVDPHTGLPVRRV